MKSLTADAGTSTWRLRGNVNEDIQVILYNLSGSELCVRCSCMCQTTCDDYVIFDVKYVSYVRLVKNVNRRRGSSDKRWKRKAPKKESTS